MNSFLPPLNFFNKTEYDVTSDEWASEATAIIRKPLTFKS